VLALATELPIASVLPVICAADTFDENDARITTDIANILKTRKLYLFSLANALMRFYFLSDVVILLFVVILRYHNINGMKIVLLLIGFLTAALLPAAASNASPYGAGKYSAVVPYGGQTNLTISTSGNVSIPITPGSSATLATAAGTVTVVSTDTVGYKLYIRALGSANMTSGANTIPASGNGAAAALETNTWGYNLDASTNFVGMTTSDVLIRTGTGPFESGDVTTVTYGVKIDQSKAAGSYSTTVIYTAVPQTT
jgi:hypothetical protein